MTPAPRTCPKCGTTYGPEVIFCQNDGTVLDQSAGHMTGQIIADRYRVISHIGEGGMGQVYLAEHVHMKRKCALKFLNPDLAGNSGALKRFYREAENASRIDHPNVVTVYDFGEAAGGSIYLAMEFVEGESLHKRIERDSAMPRDVIASIVRQTASALQAAHVMQIVHRDLKPDNIMLVTRDGDMRVKVVDFGIAKAKGAEKVTMTGAIVGTPDYMSPEQLTGDEVDGRTDQYALALVAVKMLTGKLPFATTTSIESLTSRLTTNPMPLRALRTDITWPQQLQDVIARALSSDPALRYPSVVEFSRAFDKAIGKLSGALAATVADLQVGDIVPPTRERRSEPSNEGRQRGSRRMWPLAAAATVLVMAGGTAVVWSGKGRGSPPGSDTLQLSRPQPASVTPSGASGRDSTVQLQADTGSLPLTGAPSVPNPALFSKAADQKAAANERPKPKTLVKQAASSEPPREVNQERQRLLVRDTARPPSRDTTPTSTPAPIAPPVEAQAPAQPPTLSAAEVTSELSGVRALVAPDAPSASLASAVSKVNAILPRVGERSDSIRLLYVRAQAHTLQEDLGNACKTLSTALGLAKGSSLEAALARTSAQLNCP